MRRVVIAGCPGAGKSHTARILSTLTGLPVIHLDRHYWQPGWQRPSPEAWRATIADLVARPKWIMDGNYGGTLPLRLAKADTLIYLDFPTALCATRVLRRSLLARGSTRGGELPDGCLERFNWLFFPVRPQLQTDPPRPGLEKHADLFGKPPYVLQASALEAVDRRT